jgi:hypothetical protein
VANNYKKGDIAVFYAIGKHTSGHVQIYNGSKWISDFKQNKFYPYADGSEPDYTVYRL